MKYQKFVHDKLEMLVLLFFLLSIMKAEVIYVRPE